MNLIGTTLLNRYKVQSLVASGGMGAVYLVYDTVRQAQVAMKVLHQEFAANTAVLNLFKREAETLSTLSHPHIIPFYGFHQENNLAFIIEKYVDGATVDEIQRARKKPLEPRQALTILKAVGSALDFAHSQNLVHCDVKPNNVMIDKGGSLFLTDFGIARHAQSTATAVITAGTFAYMAPEQIRGEPLSSKTDVYALGITFYELVTGFHPYRSADDDSDASSGYLRMSEAQQKQDPPDPARLNPRLPQALGTVILKAMAKEPSARYATAQEFFSAACQVFGLPESIVPDRFYMDELNRLAPELFAPRVAPRAAESHDEQTLVHPPDAIPPAKRGFAQALAASSVRVGARQVRLPLPLGALLIGLLALALVSLILVSPLVRSPAAVPNQVAATLPADSLATAVARLETATQNVLPSLAPRVEPSLTVAPTRPEPSATLTALPSPTWTSEPTITQTPTATIKPEYPYDLAFSSNRNGQMKIHLANTADLKDYQTLPLASPYNIAYWPTFLGAAVFAEFRSSQNAAEPWIYRINPTTAEVDRFPYPGDGAPTSLAVPRGSPDGRFLAYSANLKDKWFLIVSILSENKNKFKFSYNPPFRLVGYVDWFFTDSETHLGFLWMGVRLDDTFDINQSLFWTESDGGKTSLVTHGKYPALSPDGTLLAYFRPGDHNLVVMNMQTRRQLFVQNINYSRKLYGKSEAASAAWSADGKWLYYASVDGGDWDIFRIRRDGSDKENVTKDWTSDEIMPALRW